MLSNVVSAVIVKNSNMYSLFYVGDAASLCLAQRLTRVAVLWLLINCQVLSWMVCEMMTVDSGGGNGISATP